MGKIEQKTEPVTKIGAEIKDAPLSPETSEILESVDRNEKILRKVWDQADLKLKPLQADILEVLYWARPKKYTRISMAVAVDKSPNYVSDQFNILKSRGMVKKTSSKALKSLFQLTEKGIEVLMDDRKVRDELKLEFVPLEDSLADTISWLAEAGHIDEDWARNIT